MAPKPTRLAALLAGGLLLQACAKDTTRDQGPDSHDLNTMQATIWVDPDGCKHWVIDDGVEGYMSPALLPDGRPDCV